eukprot:1193304-Prorocentrum_minimum.AAC.2
MNRKRCERANRESKLHSPSTVAFSTTWSLTCCNRAFKGGVKGGGGGGYARSGGARGENSPPKISAMGVGEDVGGDVRGCVGEDVEENVGEFDMALSCSATNAVGLRLSESPCTLSLYGSCARSVMRRDLRA